MAWAGLSSALALVSAFAISALPVRAGEVCARDAMIVFDGSGSMAEMGFNLLSEPRIMSARRAVVQAIPEVAATRKLGLIVYGPGGADACSNIELRFPPEPDAAKKIIDAVDRLAPAGDTPLTEAVSMAAEVLDYRERAGVVVLVTDGKETCGGAPCQMAASLMADARDLTVHVIGFRLQSDHFDYPNAPESEQDEGFTVAKCMADLTGGIYVSAWSVDELVEALKKTLGCTLIGALPERRRAG